MGTSPAELMFGNCVICFIQLKHVDWTRGLYIGSTNHRSDTQIMNWGQTAESR